MSLVVWVIAVVVAILGLVNLLQGDILFGLLLLVVAAAIGPGGWTIWSRRG